MAYVQTSTVTFTVASQDDLRSALAQAKAGDKILLESGDYGALVLNGRRDPFLDFDGPVTIAAANPDAPPVFSGLDVRFTSGLTFEGLHFDYSYQDGQPIWFKPFKAWTNTDISFIGNRFTGDVAQGLSEFDNGFPTGFGLNIRGSQNVTVTQNDISGFFRGLTVADTDAVTVLRNDIHGIRMDGMNFAAVQGVLIEDNTLHNFVRSLGSADHADMIQFWTNGTTRPSTDIVIRGNTLDLGAGHYTQSIFMRNDQVDLGLAGEEMFYRNILIEDNVIYNAHLHGITVGETAGLTIRNNSVLTADGATEGGAVKGVQTPRIAVAETSTDVTVTQNVTASINGFSGQKDWTVTDNVLVQRTDPAAPGFYDNVFINSTLGIADGRHNFIARPDGEIFRLDAGAQATRTAITDAGFTIRAETPGAAQQVFDASVIADALPEGAKLLWDFGDGTTATGMIATHSFAAPGRHDVTLQVISPDGSLYQAQASVTVQSAHLLRMGSDGTFTGWTGESFDIVAEFSATAQGGLQLGGPGITASVARNVIAPMLNKEDVSISFGLAADLAGATGEVFRLHKSLLVSVDRNGHIDLRALSSEGDSVRLIGTDAPVNTGNPHKVEITLRDGQIAIQVDGKVQAQADFAGTFADQGRHDLTFGNPWHEASRLFDGKLTDFAIILESGSHMRPEDLTEAAQPTDMATSIAAPENITTDVQPIPPLQAGLAMDQTAQDCAANFPDSPASARTVQEIQLGGAGIQASLERGMIQTLFTDRELDISFSLTATGDRLSGEVFRLHQAFMVDIDKSGAVVLRAWSSEGDAVRLVSTGVSITDRQTHDIDIKLANETLSLWINGAPVAEAEFKGTFLDLGRHDLTFGNPWHDENRFFEAELSRFEITFEPDLQIDAFSTWAGLSDMPLI